MSFCLFPHILLRCLLDEKGLAAVPKLHVQVHRLPIDFYVNLQENQIDESSSSSSAEVTGSTCLLQSLWGGRKKNCAKDLAEELGIKLGKEDNQSFVRV